MLQSIPDAHWQALKINVLVPYPFLEKSKILLQTPNRQKNTAAQRGANYHYFISDLYIQWAVIYVGKTSKKISIIVPGLHATTIEMILYFNGGER